MQMEETIIALTAIILGSLVVLIPITGITARIALKPLMESMARYREMQGANEAQQLLERRVALMEEQLHSMERTLQDVSEASDFNRQLQGTPRPAISAPAPAGTSDPVVAMRPDQVKA